MRIEIINDKEKVNKVRVALKANDGYCPCQIDKSERTKCICLNFLEGEDEWCHCGIYRKIEE
jgi:hypothetical protein